MNVTRMSLLLVASFSAIGCGNHANESQTKNVFGEDNREEMRSTTGVYKKIGMVTGGGKMCTGSLVWHNLVLTNAHCVFKDGELIDDLKFHAGKGTRRSETFDVQHVWWGTANPQENREQDWAIMLLDRSSRRGYFGYKSQQNLDPLRRPILMVGYSGDFYRRTGAAGVHRDCRVRGVSGATYLHDCDTRGGSSGGPLLATQNGDYFVIGVNAAHRLCENRTECADGISYSDARANIAVRTNAFTQELTQLRRAYPRP